MRTWSVAVAPVVCGMVLATALPTAVPRSSADRTLPGRAQVLRARPDPNRQKLLERLEPYLVILRKYRGGDFDGAVKDLKLWTRPQVEQAIKDLTEAGIGVPDPCSTDPRRVSYTTYEAAALLHFDMVHSEMHTLPVGWITTNLSWAAGLLLTLRTDVAARTKAGFRPACAEEMNERAKDWFLALAETVQGYWMFTAADDMIGNALEMAPDDAGVLFVAGTIKEALAFDRGVREQSQSPEGDDRAKALRRDAEALYRRVLDADGSLVEARLRLGRVLALTGRPDAAASELDAVLQTTRDPRLLFLANLFRGGLYERQARWTDATVCYRNAVEVTPESQAARIALSHALARSGDERGARDAARAFFGAGPSLIRGDAWWGYPFGWFEKAAPILDRLRLEVTVP